MVEALHHAHARLLLVLQRPQREGEGGEALVHLVKHVAVFFGGGGGEDEVQPSQTNTHTDDQPTRPVPAISPAPSTSINRPIQSNHPQYPTDQPTHRLALSFRWYVLSSARLNTVVRVVASRGLPEGAGPHHACNSIQGNAGVGLVSRMSCICICMCTCVCACEIRTGVARFVRAVWACMCVCVCTEVRGM
jgi:hypothetical protein